jgi:transcriptional regulator with XRE-family HTH domain
MAMATIKWHLGHVIHNLRAEQGWTQGQLAKRADMNKATVVSIEKMDRNHGRETYEKVARAFGLSVAELWALVPTEETRREAETAHAGAGSAAVNPFRQRPTKDVAHGAAKKRR